MKNCSRVIQLLLFACFLPVSAIAQSLPTSQADEMEGIWLVAGKVKTFQGDPIRGAAVTVTPLVGAETRTLATDAQGKFRYEYTMNVGLVPEFSVVFTVKKKGFQTAHAYITYTHPRESWEVPLTLREDVEDPELLPTADLISGLAPKLKRLSPADGLSTKSEKDYVRGVADFLDRHHIDAAVPLLTKVLERDASCTACRTMLGLAQLEWRDWDGANHTLVEGIRAVQADPKLARPELFAAYGTWESWHHDLDKAEYFFQEALKLAPQDPLALQELGRTQVSMQEYDAAAENLRDALAAGAGPEARLLYVEALLGEGHPNEAANEMNQYLGGRDVKTMPVLVRQVWANVQNRERVETTYFKAKGQKGQAHLDFLQRPPADLIQGLVPAKDQEQLISILDGVGANISEMIKNFPNTSSLEMIHQEKIGHKGDISDEQNQKFRYLCIVPSQAWGPGFTEYRADLSGSEALPKGLAEGFMLTKGFASTELTFHPNYRSENNFRYLGQQKVNGRNTYVVAFAQIPGKAHLTGSFRSGQTSVTTFSQGLAWIDTANYQIIRLHTDLLTPLPDLKLDREAMNIEFNEVHFKHQKEALWLPQEVSVTLNWNGKELRNTHDYSDFRIFKVDATEKIGKPKESAQSSKGTPVSALHQ
jgi:tetratricopeptide (TPR) repeat protein